MDADLITSTVCVALLGTTPRYTVYHVVFAPSFATDPAGQAQYQAHIDQLVDAAAAAHRRLWLVLDPSRLPRRDTLRLLYRFALPNLFKPVTVRTYNADYHTVDETDQELHAMLLLIRAAMRVTPWAATFQGALPPGFVPTTRDDNAALRVMHERRRAI